VRASSYRAYFGASRFFSQAVWSSSRAGRACQRVGCFSEEKYSWILFESYWIIISFDSRIETDVRTPSISRASTTLTQSRSVILNAVQGMCFTTQLSWRNVVIGLYIWSADVTNKPIGFYVNHVSILAKRIKKAPGNTWRSLLAWSSSLNAVPQQTLLCKGILSASGRPDGTWMLPKYLMRCPDAWIYTCLHEMWISKIKRCLHTLIARVRIAAITSREPPKTRLSSRVGSYSQIAVAFLTAAIFVMRAITSMFPRLTMCPKQLWKELSIQQKLSWK